MRQSPGQNRQSAALNSLSGHFIDVSEIGATRERRAFEDVDAGDVTQPRLDPDSGPLGMAARGAESYGPTITSARDASRAEGPRVTLPVELRLDPTNDASTAAPRTELLNEARFRLAMRARTERADEEAWLAEPFENPPRIVLNPDEPACSAWQIEACERYVAGEDRDLVERLVPAWQVRMTRQDRLSHARDVLGRNAAGARSAVGTMARRARAASSALTLMAMAGASVLGIGVLATSPSAGPAAGTARPVAVIPDPIDRADAAVARFAFAADLREQREPAHATAFDTRFGPVPVAAGDDRIRLYLDRRMVNAPIANPIHQASFDLIVPTREAEGVPFPLRIEPRARLKSLGAILITGLPENSVLSAGTRINRDSWGLLPDQIDDLKLWLADTAPEEFTLDVRVFQPSGLTAGRSELRVRRGALYPASGPLPRPNRREEIASRATPLDGGALERVVATTVERPEADDVTRLADGAVVIRSGHEITTALVGAEALVEDGRTAPQTSSSGLIAASLTADARPDTPPAGVRLINRQPAVASIAPAEEMPSRTPSASAAASTPGRSAARRIERSQQAAEKSDRATDRGAPVKARQTAERTQPTERTQTTERTRTLREPSQTAAATAKRMPDLPERRPDPSLTPTFALGATNAESSTVSSLLQPLPAWANKALKINGH